MLRFDAVTFMSYLDNLRATEGVKSVWLFHSGGCAVAACWVAHALRAHMRSGHTMQSICTQRMK